MAGEGGKEKLGKGNLHLLWHSINVKLFTHALIFTIICFYILLHFKKFLRKKGFLARAIKEHKRAISNSMRRELLLPNRLSSLRVGGTLSLCTLTPVYLPISELKSWCALITKSAAHILDQEILNYFVNITWCSCTAQCLHVVEKFSCFSFFYRWSVISFIHWNIISAIAAAQKYSWKHIQ